MPGRQLEDAGTKCFLCQNGVAARSKALISGDKHLR